MTSIDLDLLLQPVPGDQPGGSSLDGDPDYMGLEIAATRKAEVEVGGVITPAEEPDWQIVQQSAVELLGRSKNVQIAILLTEALIHNEGLEGMKAGLRLVHGLLDEHWAYLHPELDEEDPDGAASTRIMRLKNLGDRSRIVRALRLTPLVDSRMHGTFSLGDVKAITKGLEDGEDGAADRQAALQDSLQAADADDLSAIVAAADVCRETLKAIAEVVDERSELREDLGLSAVDETIGEISDLLREQLTARGVSLNSTLEGDQIATTDNLASSNGQLAGSSSATNLRGPITSRDEAIKSLDLVCRYFEQHEPSSPVPLLLMRAKRLVAKDFMAILEDLAPDGVDDAKKVVGDVDGRSSSESVED